MTKEEALKMCLEYIETNAHERRLVRWAIKDALAELKQEPVQDENAIRADEREECAKMCEKVAVDYYTRIGREHEPYMRATAEDCARHIRARAQPDERNFCPRCGKRTADLTTIHTCTPPQSQWVNLTVDELIDLERKHLSHENLTRAIEAKLREKNT